MRVYTDMVLSSSANLYIKTRMSSMYNCDSVAVLNYSRRNNPHKPTKKTAHFYVFCGVQKLNTLNLRLFHSPSNPRNHFSTVLIETNWYTTSCKYSGCSGLTSVTIPASRLFVLFHPSKPHHPSKSHHTTNPTQTSPNQAAAIKNRRK